jgi:hypothetical protein
MSHQHVRETAKDGKQCSLEVLPRTAVINGPLVWTPGASNTDDDQEPYLGSFRALPHGNLREVSGRGCLSSDLRLFFPDIANRSGKMSRREDNLLRLSFVRRRLGRNPLVAASIF